MPPNFFLLHATKEGLCYRIVIAATSATHARTEMMLATETQPRITAELRALIRMNNDFADRLSPPNRHQQCIQYNFRLFMPNIFFP
jgi:hypothetical protein